MAASNDNDSSSHFIIWIVLLALIAIMGWFFTVLMAMADTNGPNILSGPSFTLLISALFGAATVVLAGTAVTVAVVTFFGFRQVRRSAISAAVEQSVSQSISAATETAESEARKAAEAKVPLYVESFLRREIESNGFIRKHISDRVNKIVERLLSQTPAKHLDALVEAKVKAELERRSYNVDLDDALNTFPDTPSGDDPENIRRTRETGTNSEAEVSNPERDSDG
ncbi:hypothetical protein [Oceanicaulis sp.]|uniref:hypothetical protein n=1 Tax=Oceanicaulis sp. TaxID=1924941 RepID=UPI003F716DE6